ncbi:MAG: hypothetical protein QQW96_09160 [Tychonema bourrellyi B0820]|nr:hypothetical protein [Tychonema bourrellyi B0820]
MTVKIAETIAMIAFCFFLLPTSVTSVTSVTKSVAELPSSFCYICNFNQAIPNDSE